MLDGRCPLEELELSGTSLCLSQPGRFSTDALRLVCALASREGTRLRKLGLRGTHLCGLAPGSDVGDRYILDGVALLCGALMSPHCALEEVDLSENGIKAEREPQPPSRLPAKLYGYTRHDGAALARLAPPVRSRLLRFLGYPAPAFEHAAGRGFDLPPLDSVASMDPARFLALWGQATEANRPPGGGSRSSGSGGGGGGSGGSGGGADGAEGASAATEGQRSPPSSNATAIAPGVGHGRAAAATRGTFAVCCERPRRLIASGTRRATDAAAGRVRRARPSLRRGRRRRRRGGGGAAAAARERRRRCSAAGSLIETSRARARPPPPSFRAP